MNVISLPCLLKSVRIYFKICMKQFAPTIVRNNAPTQEPSLNFAFDCFNNPQSCNEK